MLQAKVLFSIRQRYKFESKSQPIIGKHQDLVIVFDTSKIQI